MKSLALIFFGVVALSTSARADVECRLTFRGVDQGEGITAFANGTCRRSNDYHYSEYSLTVSRNAGGIVYLCTNRLPNSWFPAATRIIIRNGRASMQEFNGTSWQQGFEVTCH